MNATWTEKPPTESGEWWWWNGDNEDAVLVFVNCTDKCARYFSKSGHDGWSSRFRWLDEMRGHWMKAAIPTPPADDSDR